LRDPPPGPPFSGAPGGAQKPCFYDNLHRISGVSYRKNGVFRAPGAGGGPARPRGRFWGPGGAPRRGGPPPGPKVPPGTGGPRATRETAERAREKLVAPKHVAGLMFGAHFVSIARRVHLRVLQ